MDSIKFLDPTTQFVLFSVLKVILVFSIGMGGVAYSVLVERKVSAWIQDRPGPNRVAPFFVEFIPVIGPWLVRGSLGGRCRTRQGTALPATF